MTGRMQEKEGFSLGLRKNEIAHVCNPCWLSLLVGLNWYVWIVNGLCRAHYAQQLVQYTGPLTFGCLGDDLFTQQTQNGANAGETADATHVRSTPPCCTFLLVKLQLPTAGLLCIQKQGFACRNAASRHCQYQLGQVPWIS